VRIAIFGSGAVGGYFGGRLAQAGERVAFIARGEHLAALRRGGLRVTSTHGDFVVNPVEATDDPFEIGVVDLVLVGVKAWQVPDAARAIRPLVGPGTAVVPLQNGIEAPEQLSHALGPEPVLGGYCRLLARVAAPGHLDHAGGEPCLGFGELDGRVSDRVRAIAEVFERASGFATEVPADVRVAMWAKFIFIAAASAVGALTDSPFGRMRTEPATRRMLEGALTEAYEVGRANGVALPDDTVATTLAFVDTLPAGGTTSMQRDIAAGRPSELDAQAGAVVRLAERLGVAVPTYRQVYDTLLPRERHARGAHEPLRGAGTAPGG
jgi:2-dehydropantoate 2-reductase